MYPESIGKTSSDEPEGGEAVTGAERQKMKCGARTAAARENKMLLFSSFILELLENKLLLEKPFLDCCVTEMT